EAQRLALVDEAEVRVRVVEVLRDAGIRARVDLALELTHVVLGAARPWMDLGVVRDLHAKVIAGLRADQLDQLVGVAELAGRRRPPRGDVPAERDQPAHAERPVGLQLFDQRGARGADAGQMRRHREAPLQELPHRLVRALAGRAAGAVGDGEEVEPQLRELRAGFAQLRARRLVARRKELDAESAAALLLRLHAGRLSTGSARTCTALPWARRCSAPARR